MTKRKPRVRKPNICEQMAEKIAKLPNVLPAYELRREQAYLWAYPTLMEANIIGNNIDKDMTLEDSQKLIELKDKRTEMKRELREMLLCNISDDNGYRVSVFKPKGRGNLVKKISTVGTCWSDDYEKNSERLMMDLELGGSIVLFSEKRKGKRYKPTVFSRSNICTGMDNELLLFVDTIENGSTGTQSISGWGDRQSELTMVTTGWMHIARYLGMETLGLGEIELYELGKKIGVPTKKLFRAKKPENRKIGISVYCWRLKDSREGRYYAMDLNLALGLSKKRRDAEEAARQLSKYRRTLTLAKNTLESVNNRYR